MNGNRQTDFALQLDSQFNANKLYDIWFTPISDFLFKNIGKSWDGISAREMLVDPTLHKKPKKEALAMACARFYLNEKALNDFYESQTDEDKAIIEKATWAVFLTYKDLNKIYGRPVVRAVQEDNNRYGTSFELVNDMILQKWFPLMGYHKVWYPRSAQECLVQSDLKLTFPRLMQEAYSEILPKPEGYYLEAAKLPADTEIFNAEEDIFREFPLITAYYLQNKIRYTLKGYPTTGSGRKISKALQLKGFPEEGESGMRGLLIAGLLADDFKMSAVAQTTLDILKQLFARDFNRYPPSPYLLFELKGINNFHHYSFFDDITNKVLDIFRKMPPGEWVTFKNLQLYAATHFINVQPLASLYELPKLFTIDYTGRQQGIGTHNINEFIAIPNFAGHIYLLAAFGLMELCIDTGIPMVYSYYDALYACRLTALGKYILGLQKEYFLPEIHNKTQLSFDENGPFIRIEGNLALGDAMLGNYAVKVSENRYQFSPGKFLKDCKSGKDLKNKIALFKQTVGQKLPAFWETYLEQLIENCQAITVQRNTYILKLPSENRDLHRLIAQDNILRPLIIKAEKFHILVEESDIPAFMARMKELGYLI